VTAELLVQRMKLYAAYGTTKYCSLLLIRHCLDFSTDVEQTAFLAVTTKFADRFRLFLSLWDYGTTNLLQLWGLFNPQTTRTYHQVHTQISVPQFACNVHHSVITPFYSKLDVTFLVRVRVCYSQGHLTCPSSVTLVSHA